MSRVEAPTVGLKGLLDAIASGNVELVRALTHSLRERINESVTLVHPSSSIEDDADLASQHTALGTAVGQGNLEIVRILLTAGADPKLSMEESCFGHRYSAFSKAIQVYADNQTSIPLKKIISELTISIASKYGDISPEILEGNANNLLHAIYDLNTDALLTLLPDNSKIRQKIANLPQSHGREARIKSFRDFKNFLETKFEEESSKSGGGSGGSGVEHESRSEIILNPKQTAAYATAELIRDNFLERVISTFKKPCSETERNSAARAVFSDEFLMKNIESFLPTAPLHNLTKSQQDIVRNALADFLFLKPSLAPSATSCSETIGDAKGRT